MPVTAQLIPVGTWTADPVHSSTAFEVEHLGVSTFSATFSDVEATLVANEDAIALEGGALIESVSVKEPDFRGHLLSPEFFDVERHAHIRFASTDVRPNGEGEIAVDGDLTIKGTTMRISAAGRVGSPASIRPAGSESQSSSRRPSTGATLVLAGTWSSRTASSPSATRFGCSPAWNS